MTRLLVALSVLACVASAEEPPAPTAIEEAGLRQLRTVRRVFVDRLIGGETAAQMRDILISSLVGAKLFILTENQERADAVLRGASEDLVFTDVHTSSDSLNAHANFGAGASSSRARAPYGGMGVGQSDSEHSAERRHEAIAAVRLVTKDGDVIWSTTQESLGARFRGASADVADKITAQLKEDFERARKLR
ncbi:MAG: hypothetical protein LAP40_13155 [Acidobacteriia bacterium]|nr:hypothetical protein [Terriglobia bacterium]